MRLGLEEARAEALLAHAKGLFQEEIAAVRGEIEAIFAG